MLCVLQLRLVSHAINASSPSAFLPPGPAPSWEDFFFFSFLFFQSCKPASLTPVPTPPASLPLFSLGDQEMDTNAGGGGWGGDK